MQGVAITFEPKDFLHIKEVGRDHLAIWREGSVVCAGRGASQSSGGKRLLNQAELG